MMKLLLAASSFALALTAPARAEDIVIDNVTLVDGTSQPVQQAMSVGITAGRFTFVTPTAAAPKVPGRRIDGTGKFLVPGFIDVHIHLKGPANAHLLAPDHADKLDEDELPPQASYTPAELKTGRELGIGALAGFLYSGVTTVYDAGNYPEFIMGLRAEERAGTILSPHILATGNIVTSPGGHGDGVALRIADWPSDRRKFLTYLREVKPDIVKLTLDEHGWGTRPMIPALPIDLMQDIITEANRHGIRTTAHTSSETRAMDAIYAGVDSLAHPVIQGPISHEFALLMGAKKTPMATTLTIGDGYSRLVEHPEYLDQPLYQASLSGKEIADLRSKTLPLWKERGWTWWMKLMTPIAQDNLKQIHAAGGVVAIATDQTIGPAVHREMELMQAVGIPAKDIITMATLNGARHLGREGDMGSVEPGKIADAVMLSADPTADINNAKAIWLVIKDGKLVDEDRLPLPGGKRPLRRDVR